MAGTDGARCLTSARSPTTYRRFSPCAHSNALTGGMILLNRSENNSKSLPMGYLTHSFPPLQAGCRPTSFTGSGQAAAVQQSKFKRQQWFAHRGRTAPLGKSSRRWTPASSQRRASSRDPSRPRLEKPEQWFCYATVNFIAFTAAATGPGPNTNATARGPRLQVQAMKDNDAGRRQALRGGRHAKIHLGHG
jgi:hypothetical protein